MCICDQNDTNKGKGRSMWFNVLEVLVLCTDEFCDSPITTRRARKRCEAGGGDGDGEDEGGDGGGWRSSHCSAYPGPSSSPDPGECSVVAHKEVCVWG